jgi:tetratricopeptide (TPR) repeat protein
MTSGKKLCAVMLFLLTAAVFVASADDLDKAIETCARQVEGALAPGTLAAVIGFEASSPEFSTYLTEEFMGCLIQGKKITVVDRQNIGLLYDELHFNRSGYVSGETAQYFGKMVGARSAVTGAVRDTGGTIRIEVKAFDVKTLKQNVNFSINLDKKTELLKVVKAIENGGVRAKPLPAGNVRLDLGNGTPQLPNYLDEAEISLFDGVVAEEDKNYDKAIECFNRAVSLNPDFYYAYIRRGDAYYNKGDFNTALTNYSFVMEHIPGDPIVYNNRGCTYKDMGKFWEALADFNEAVRLRSDYPEPYYNRANVYYDSGDYDRAVINFNKVIDLVGTITPRYGWTYINRGTTYHMASDLNKAIADYTMSINLGLYPVEAYINRAQAYELKYNYDKAIADYTEAIKLDPDNAIAYVHRGFMYYYKNDLIHARADLAVAIRLNPADPSTADNLNILRSRLGQ